MIQRTIKRNELWCEKTNNKIHFTVTLQCRKDDRIKKEEEGKEEEEEEKKKKKRKKKKKKKKKIKCNKR